MTAPRSESKAQGFPDKPTSSISIIPKSQFARVTTANTWHWAAMLLAAMSVRLFYSLDDRKPPMPRLKNNVPRKKARQRASKSSKASAVGWIAGPLRKPEGDLAMMLAQMNECEQEAQVKAETAVKVRRRIINWLRARRLAGNVPLRNVAAAVGRHEVSLARVELGVTVAKNSTLQKLLAFYGFAWDPTPRFFTSDPHGPKHRQE